MSRFVVLPTLAGLLVAGLAGCGGSPRPGPSTSATPSAAPVTLQTSPAADPPPPDTAQGRIAAALSAGRIDYGTSLAYRFDALLGSDALPAEYRAAEALTEDPTLADEAMSVMTE